MSACNISPTCLSNGGAATKPAVQEKRSEGTDLIVSNGCLKPRSYVRVLVEMTCMDVAVPMVIGRAADFGVLGADPARELTGFSGDEGSPQRSRKALSHPACIELRFVQTALHGSRKGS